MPWWFFKQGGGGEPEQQKGEPTAGAGQLMSGSAGWGPTYRLPQPKGWREIDRLDLLHYALQAVLQANYLAPIGKPRHILDTGCGTARWAYELCQEFPQATVIGLDLEPIRSTALPPPNFRFVRANLLDGLPFASNSVDFVHQRLMALSLPITCWPVLVKDLARVTAPGGWVELVEGGAEIAPAGPATQEVFSLIGHYLQARGLDGQGNVARSLVRYLEEAGLSTVQQRTVSLPVGEWGGPIGHLIARDFHETFLALRERVAQRFQLPAEAFVALLQSMQRECRDLRTCYSFTVAYGQKR
ncbi:class I SAM-dependent methyltransferase [Thermogemmatispora onikobensis]|uniref:class I SAM-dependent methyltransferase n=1 Tax=Thermogemmatispora onikobensis TaxID=732234 RepID=UPI000853363C|nr:class I SAM-dependent methyltransferase [Thermogemmatispora onikobensis]